MSTSRAADQHQIGVPTLLCTPSEAAHALRISRTALFQLLRSDELRSVKLGRARRIPIRTLHEFIASQASDK
jgi:excisionase family DNA binding protein